MRQKNWSPVILKGLLNDHPMWAYTVSAEKHDSCNDLGPQDGLIYQILKSHFIEGLFQSLFNRTEARAIIGKAKNPEVFYWKGQSYNHLGDPT